jgi:hypothetical protein
MMLKRWNDVEEIPKSGEAMECRDDENEVEKKGDDDDRLIR